MFDRLEDTVNRYEDITAELGNPDVVNDQEKFRKLMKELSIRTVRRILRTVLLFLMKRQMKNLKRWRRKNLMNLRQE